MQLGTSENIRLLSKSKCYNIIKLIPYKYSYCKGNNKFNNNYSSTTKINQWLAGLIDGKGSFLLSKKGFTSLEIIMDIKDSLCLYKIKNIYGGSIKIRSGSNSIRYRLHHKEGLLRLINDVNGEIRYSNRIKQ